MQPDRATRAFCQVVPGPTLSLTDSDLKLAANLWGRVRNAGIPAACADALDGNLILAAQTLSQNVPHRDLFVATTNPSRHYVFVPADLRMNTVP